MYFVKYIEGSWQIVDSNEQTLFIGTKQQVEEWLDCQENAVQRPSLSAVSGSRSLLALLTKAGRYFLSCWTRSSNMSDTSGSRRG